MMKRIAPESWLPHGVPTLEPAALEVVRSTRNTLVVAGPGAGKTELLAESALIVGLQSDRPLSWKRQVRDTFATHGS